MMIPHQMLFTLTQSFVKFVVRRSIITETVVTRNKDVLRTVLHYQNLKICINSIKINFVAFFVISGKKNPYPV